MQLDCIDYLGGHRDRFIDPLNKLSCANKRCILQTKDSVEPIIVSKIFVDVNKNNYLCTQTSSEKC